MNFISAFDLHIEQALYAIRDPSPVQFFTWVTELASTTTVLGITSIIIIILAYRKRWALVAGLCTTTLGSGAVAFILKDIVARPRPGAPLYAFVETSYSFPSGHATFSVAMYGFVLWLLYDTIPVAWRYVAIVAVTIVVFAVGFSRLYLGVHYPSDVIAGYILGGLFVLLGIKVTKYLERRTTFVSQ
ncbi:MAG: phosphatase PAP2 family protein [bacterium]|nr:phosphatase PAP2 family protein [bacterium]